MAGWPWRGSSGRWPWRGGRGGAASGGGHGGAPAEEQLWVAAEKKLRTAAIAGEHPVAAMADEPSVAVRETDDEHLEELRTVAHNANDGDLLRRVAGELRRLAWRWAAHAHGCAGGSSSGKAVACV
ncbi:unnamed protein product [Urochloa humidicola]